MRVTFDNYTRQLLPRLEQLNGQQNAARTQLTSGQRVTKPSDDPAAIRRVLNLGAAKKQEQQYFQNARRALDVNQASFAALDQMQKLGTRATELAALSTSFASAEDFAAYGAEVNQVLEQAISAANTKFGGDHLFGGTRTDTTPFEATRDSQGRITAVAYQGAANGPGFRMSAGETVSPYTTGAENQQMADYLNTLVALRDAMNTGDADAVAAVRPSLSNQEDALLVTLSRTASVQYRIDVSSRDAGDHFEALEGMISREADVDYAEAAVRLNRAQTAYQVALQSAARIEGNSLLDYLR